MLEHEAIEPSITFKQALLETIHKPGRVYEGPDVIDLSTLQPDIEELIDFTLSHPKKHEAGRYLVFENGGKLTTNKKIVEGITSRVQLHLNIGIAFGLPRHLRQNRYVASEMHSHPIDGVFSPPDLVSLLLSDDAFDNTASSLVITPARKILAFRGKETPSFDRRSAEAVATLLTGLLVEKAGSKSFLIGTNRKIRASVESHRDIFRRMTDVFKFQVFEGGVRDRYVRRVSPDEIQQDI